MIINTDTKYNNEGEEDNLRNFPYSYPQPTELLPITTYEQQVQPSHSVIIAEDNYNNIGLQEKIFEGFLVAFSNGLMDPHLEDLKFKIISNGGQFFDTINDKVNIIIVPSTNIIDEERIEHATKYHLPIVLEQYVMDCVSYGTRLDWNQYCITNPNYFEQQSTSDVQPLASIYNQLPPSTTTTSTPTIHQQTHNPNAPNFSVKIFVKGSRQTVFCEQFPEVLYTLTWKHKYDVRIVCSDKIFLGKNQMKIMEGIDMFLVMGYNDRVPVFTEESSVSSSVADIGGSSPKKKKKGATKKKSQGTSQPKKSEDKSTISISSVHRSSDDEIIIRFGINSLYCSKRFHYMPFRLCVKYTPNDSPDDYHFTVYSAEFKTFVKKDANIAKYLNQPMPLNPTVKVITKACTTTTKVEYAKYMTTTTTNTNGKGNETGQKQKRKSNGTTSKKRKKQSEEEIMNPLLNMPVNYPFMPDPTQGQWGMNDMYNPFMPPLFPNPSLFPPSDQSPLFPPVVNPVNTITWFGEPVGMNVNGDVFYGSFLKDGIMYRVNDLVFVSPEDSNENTEDDKVKQEKDDAIDIMGQSDQKWIDKYWVCKIINLIHTKNEGMRFIGQWFYRYCDVEGFGCNIDEATQTFKLRKTHTAPSEKEVFVSFDIYYNTLTTIKGKCYAKHIDPEVELENYKKWLEDEHHFFYQCGYNRSKNELFELQEQMLKVLKESSNNEEEEIPVQPHFNPMYGLPSPGLPSGMPLYPQTPGIMPPINLPNPLQSSIPLPNPLALPNPLSNPFAPWPTPSFPPAYPSVAPLGLAPFPPSLSDTQTKKDEK
ncbi:hypothetical protein ABK040_000680 [Willaertia magna]